MSEYSRELERAFYPSYEEALLDMVCKAEELTGKRASPDRFRHMVHHAYASTWQAVWSDALLVMCVEACQARQSVRRPRPASRRELDRIARKRGL
ncbi:hypothetical protein EII34_14920 [Arachnia propionica]|uniref:Uncharacterized protein n=1 Tax=Arachnia propionica TaxID=1750 RepID=A0A3P1T126_9ACTN|nr:hypothetical protein [Arachnia propionica]RRD03197.1 hypothetical protein EII34_14920 [Arachnia propionica]